MSFELLTSESAQKIYIAILSVIVTQAINILYQNRKSKKEEKRLKYISFYQEVVHDIYNLYKTMNTFSANYLLSNPYEQKDKIIKFIENNKKSLEKKSFKIYQELKEAQLFEDGLGYYQEILEVKLFAEILDDYKKLYKPKNDTYKMLCLIQIWRITLMINSANYTVSGEVLKYSHEFDEKKLNKNLYKSLIKITAIEQREEFKNLLLQAITQESDVQNIKNIAFIPDEYYYFEDSMAIAKTHLLEIYEQDEALSIKDRQAYRDLILQYLYSIHTGTPTPYDDCFYKSENMNNLLHNTLEYLIEKNLVNYDAITNQYKITSQGIDKYEEQYLLMTAY